jgi:hypothetical protein
MYLKTVSITQNVLLYRHYAVISEQELDRLERADVA